MPDTKPAEQADDKATEATSKPAAADVAPEGEPVRYAAYNNTLLKFIGGVETSKAKAGRSEAVKEAKDAGHDVEVRAV